MEFKLLDWPTLMSKFRCPNVGNDPKPSNEKPFHTAFQADYDRIIYSKPFRRLARKTQVHPLVPNDHIHNRLTHSLEVASVGRSFASMLWDFFERTDQVPGGFNVDDFRQVLQAACLAHDIGNPPFGHAGEYAIRTWVKDNPETIFGDGEFEVSAGVRKDWEIFEGNAQGFRLALLPDNPKAGYMRLTYATLGAMVKYPWDSADPRAAVKGKYNMFSTERSAFEQAYRAMGLRVEDNFVRHPLSFLSEAADDICYRIVDLEDAVNMGILKERRVCSIFAEVCGKDDKDLPIGWLRAEAITSLISGCWSVFEQDYDSIITGKRQEDLKSGLESSQQESLVKIKDCYEEIFAHQFKVSTEFGAYRCLGRISTVLCDAARKLCRAKSFAKVDFPIRRCFDLAFSQSYATENEAQTYEWWLHQVLDCVAGMTDNYAKQFAKEIEGF